MTDLGPHLLGRLPTTPDSRDFRAANFLGVGAAVTADDPAALIAQGYYELTQTQVTFKRWAGTVYPDVTQTHWWKALDYLKRAQAAISPAPAPDPTADKIWSLVDDPILDQGQTGHCGGFGGCQWGNLEPVSDDYRNADGDALYYEAVKIGTGGRNEDGVQSRWVAQALQARGRLSTYAFASGTVEVGEWLRTKGPVMIGSDWTNDMFTPDADGFVKPTGGVAGGHFYVLCGDVFSEGYFLALNSWGDGWGQGGFFKITYSDMKILLDGVSYPGDAIVSTELAL